jgi:hypothetical protein
VVILKWSEARDFDIFIMMYSLPTQQDLKFHNVRPDRGIYVNEWQPVRRLDGVEVDYVQIGTYNGNSAYMSHYTDLGSVPTWGYNNQNYTFRVDYLFLCLPPTISYSSVVNVENTLS